ncbi:hypothetical protein WJX84_005233 [Apatococcus fuscideae]|uniref:HTH myb-type domain-containing protein n=1 Tax=Apatococcus fuscideae TaxID=2026836 RepID=A0AAW1SP35_9CHLO
MQLMSVDGLTRENVASHLQKYRLQLKRQPGDGPDDNGMHGTSLDGSLDLGLSLEATLGPSSVDGDMGNDGQGNGQAPMEAPVNPVVSAPAHPVGRPRGMMDPREGAPLPPQPDVLG